MRRLSRQLCLALLLLPLVLPQGLALCGVGEGPQAVENRLKQAMPQPALALSDFRAFSGQLARAYAEGFPFRDWMIRTGNRLRLALFRESPARSVLLGRDGWLFYKDEMELEDWLGVDLYSAEELAKAKAVLSRRREWLAGRGIVLLVVVVPNKSTMYGQHLPPGLSRLSGNTRLDQFAQAMREAGVPFLDLRQALGEGQAVRRTYWKTDSHWNGWGAFVGSRAMVEALRRNFLAMPPLREEDYAVHESMRPGGDLAAMLLLEETFREQAIDMLPLAPGRARPAEPRGYADPATLSGREMIIRETGDDSLPRAVIFRDSFSSAAWPFLAERFSRCVLLWEHRFQPHIIEREKPHVVIYEAVERYQNALFGLEDQPPPER